jgi:hypothetical protein
MSLRMLDAAGVAATDALIDVGGGASPHTGALLDRSFRDLTVLDISAAGIQHARVRRWRKKHRARRTRQVEGGEGGEAIGRATGTKPAFGR